MKNKVINTYFLLALASLTNLADSTIQLPTIPLPSVPRFFELLVSRLSGQISDDPNAHFSYNPNSAHGPSHWTGSCDAGINQSPIVYDQVPAVSSSAQGRLVMTGAYNVRPTKIKVVNNGHGAAYKFTFSGSDVPQITGGPLGTDIYKFHSFHFHYPCEHGAYKFGSSCFLEVHFVHVNAKYATLEEAASKPDGLAVIGIMYTPVINPWLYSPPYLNMLANVYNYNTEYTETVYTFTYSQAMGLTTIPKFITYKGSLTTPECAEAVTWIVVDYLFPIRTYDLWRFYYIRDSSGQYMTKNNRPYQKLNGRTLRAYNEF